MGLQVPDVALLPTQRGGDIWMNVIMDDGLPKELNRFLHEAVMKRFHELVTGGGSAHPMKPSAFQLRIESVNAPLRELCPQLRRPFLYDMLRHVTEILQEALDKKWLRWDEDLRIWIYDKGGEVIHVDFGRKR